MTNLKTTAGERAVHKNGGFGARRAAVLLLAAAVLAGGGGAAFAREATGSAEKMKRLQMLVGTWEGAGTIRRGPGEPQAFTIRERVVPRLNGEALLIDGEGKSGGRTVHQALGVIGYDAAAKRYELTTFQAGGKRLTPEIEVTETGFAWSFEQPAGTVTFTTEVKEGVWKETGVFTVKANGMKVPFFEMTLKRVDEAGK